MSEPTPYPALNGVLQELVGGARSALGANFCGAYLQGSFAVGDADEHSDVDFIVAINDDVTSPQVAALGALHERLYALDVPWAQHLEGSYVPRERLRRIDPSRTRFLYLDNGASELVWDDHCNTAVVRWSLREHGVVLAGPDPTQLVDHVGPAQLRSEAAATMPRYAAWALEPTKAGAMSRWKQPYLVLTLCRLLHTLHSGTVASKRAAGTWALEALDPEWASLIQGALDDRPDPWKRVHQLAKTGAVEQTLAFAAYAVGQSNVY